MCTHRCQLHWGCWCRPHHIYKSPILSLLLFKSLILLKKKRKKEEVNKLHTEMLTRKLYVFQFLGPLCNTVSGNYLHFTTYDSCVALPKISHVENYSTEVFFSCEPLCSRHFLTQSVDTPHAGDGTLVLHCCQCAYTETGILLGVRTCRTKQMSSRIKESKK